MWGHKKKVRGHIKKFSAGAGILPPTWKLLLTPLLQRATYLYPKLFNMYVPSKAAMGVAIYRWVVMAVLAGMCGNQL